MRKRLAKDIKAGIREAGAVERSVERMPCYLALDHRFQSIRMGRPPRRSRRKSWRCKGFILRMALRGRTLKAFFYPGDAGIPGSWEKAVAARARACPSGGKRALFMAL